MRNWIEVQGDFFTPGGDPLWECPVCGKGVHVYGVEEFGIPDTHKDKCPECGEPLQYPWESNT